MEQTSIFGSAGQTYSKFTISQRIPMSDECIHLSVNESAGVLAFYIQNGQIQVMDANFKIIGHIKHTNQHRVNCMNIWGGLLGIGGEDKILTIYDLKTLSKVKELSSNPSL